uniref:Uncharacterized protein n=1 Tax=Romanomermis culicivorax TaxID=13658 RepID=A0A915HNL0_ROMCU
MNFSQEMLNTLHVQQLINDHDYAVSKNNLEQSQNFAKELYYLKRQSMIIGNIGIIDTKVVAQDPRSISWYYAFCKVAFNDLAYARLTFEEQS